jgi:DNA invertase Pin-like site-specific DNA recombinase
MFNEDTFTGRLTGYMRVSTDDQEFALQRDALVKYGVPEDRIFYDKLSGKSMQRPGLRRAIKVCWPGDSIVVWKLDRLGRSTIGVLQQIEELAQAKIEIVSVTERLDTKTPIGKFVLTIIAAFAQMERDMISERTTAGIKAFKARGGVMGQPHPILDRPNRLAKFRALYDDGTLFNMTGQQIVDAMNACHDIETSGKNKGKRVKPLSLGSWGNTKKKVLGAMKPDEPVIKKD